MSALSVVTRQWWTAAEYSEHTAVMAVHKRLRDQDEPRRSAVMKFVRMYGNYQAFGFGSSVPSIGRPDRLRYNLAAQCVDTMLADITRSKPKATFLTDGGDWTMRQGAKALDLLIEGQMRDQGIYDGLGRMVLKDAEIAGTGLVHVYACMETLQPKIERVFPLEVLVDEADAHYGTPRQMVRQRLVDRGVLKAKLGKTAALRQAIDDCARHRPTDDDWMLATTSDDESDLVLVVEAWHLPSGRKAKDGRHVCCIEGATLVSDEWECDEFPFVSLLWDEAPAGFWGYGLVSQVEADQVELNRVLRRIQEAAGAAAGTWLVQKGSKVRKGHITDVAGQILEYEGVAPGYQVPATVPGDLVQHADRIIQRCLQRLGISEAFSQAMKPGGLVSGEAQRVYANQSGARQTTHAQAYESWHVKLADALVRVNREIYEELKDRKDAKEARELAAVKVEVQRGRRKVLKRLRFDEFALPENAYVLRAYPTSSLPSEPSGRLDTIQEWIGAGLIDANTAKSLMDFPDMAGAMDLDLADYDFALWSVETMIEDGEYVTPEPYQRLDLAFELVRRAYLRARIDGVPETRLDLLRDHLDAIDKLKAKLAQAQAAAAQQQQPTPGLMPNGMPMPGAPPAPGIAGADPSTLQAAA